MKKGDSTKTLLTILIIISIVEVVIGTILFIEIKTTDTIELGPPPNSLEWELRPDRIDPNVECHLEGPWNMECYSRYDQEGVRADCCELVDPCNLIRKEICTSSGGSGYPGPVG